MRAHKVAHIVRGDVADVLVGVRNAVIVAENVQTVVEHAEQAGVAVADAEAEAAGVGKRQHFERFVLAEQPHRTQRLHERAACLAALDGADALVDAVIFQNFGIGVVNAGVFALQDVVAVDGDFLELVGVIAVGIHEVDGGLNRDRALLIAVLLGVGRFAAHGKD